MAVRADSSEGRPISKQFEVILADSSSSYFVDVTEAKRLTATGQAKWIGQKRLRRSADASKRAIWKAKGQSAIHVEIEGVWCNFGPRDCTLQMA